MLGRGARLLGALVVLLAMSAPVFAQAPARPSVVADPNALARDVNAHLKADEICWIRSEALTVDWVAAQDPGYRRDIFSHYVLVEMEDGWRWYRRDGSEGRSVHAAETTEVEGLTDYVLEAHPGEGQGRGNARLAVQGPLSSGEIAFDWSVPPERICMADGLHLDAAVQVAQGDPGSARIVFVVPLSREQMQAEGPEVKACSPTASTAVDSEIGFDRDRGTCERPLSQLEQGSSWSIWVGLPQSFFIVYPYAPQDGAAQAPRH